MAKTATVAAQVEALRAEIRAAQDELSTVEGQPRSRAEVRAAVEDYAQQMHAEFRRRASTAQHRIAAGHRVAEAFGKPDDFASLLLAGCVGPEALAGAILAGIEDTVEVGLSQAERRQRAAELRATLDRIEAEEERLIEQSEDEGLPIPRRPNARPEIILAL